MTDPADIVTRLRAVLHYDRSVELMNRDAANEIERLRAERDEARRMLCEEWAKQDGLPLDWQGRRGAEGMAEFVKWDCFKENNND